MRTPNALAATTKHTRLWRELQNQPETFVRIYLFEPHERVDLVKVGVPANFVSFISSSMDISKDLLYTTLGLARATVNRKMRDNQRLNQDESERVLGIARLVGQAETIVRESGNPKGFDAAKWTAHWLEEPQPALGGKRPAELMDTAEGRTMVSDLLARMQSGAYA